MLPQGTRVRSQHVACLLQADFPPSRMVGAVLRHLRSLRLMRRDGGYVHMLLEEAENERMHLLTFMKIGQPSLFFRMMVLAAQGKFV